MTAKEMREVRYFGGKVGGLLVTGQADGPHWGLYPGAVSLAGEVVLRHLSVPLEVQTLGADVAHVVVELHGLAVPGGEQEGVLGGLGGVETLGPDTAVQVVPGRPGHVPVAGHVPLQVELLQLRVIEPPGWPALIAQH